MIGLEPKPSVCTEDLVIFVTDVFRISGTQLMAQEINALRELVDLVIGDSPISQQKDLIAPVKSKRLCHRISTIRRNFGFNNSQDSLEQAVLAKLDPLFNEDGKKEFTLKGLNINLILNCLHMRILWILESIRNPDFSDMLSLAQSNSQRISDYNLLLNKMLDTGIDDYNQSSIAARFKKMSQQDKMLFFTYFFPEASGEQIEGLFNPKI